MCRSLVCALGTPFVCSVLIFCVYCSYLYILLGIVCAAISQVHAVFEISGYMYQCNVNVQIISADFVDVVLFWGV
jgi:hypothetical protein